MVNLDEILQTAKIERIFTTIGSKFNEWKIKEWLCPKYAKYFPNAKSSDDIVISLPSTSNRSPKKYEDLLKDYEIIKITLDKLSKDTK